MRANMKMASNWHVVGLHLIVFLVALMVGAVSTSHALAEENTPRHQGYSRKLLAANYDKCLAYPPEMEDRPHCNSGVQAICCKTKIGAQYIGCCEDISYCSTGNHQLCCYGMPELGPWSPRKLVSCYSSFEKVKAGTVSLLRPGPEQPPKCNSVTSNDVNFSGGDLKLNAAVQGVVAPSAWQCCLRCKATPGCATWTWSARTDLRCWLKGRTGFVAVPAPGLVSGTMM